jgi:hypothetical protein
MLIDLMMITLIIVIRYYVRLLILGYNLYHNLNQNMVNSLYYMILVIYYIDVYSILKQIDISVKIYK